MWLLFVQFINNLDCLLFQHLVIPVFKDGLALFAGTKVQLQKCNIKRFNLN